MKKKETNDLFGFMKFEVHEYACGCTHVNKQAVNEERRLCPYHKMPWKSRLTRNNKWKWETNKNDRS